MRRIALSLAALLTGLLFAGLTAVVFTTGTDFSFLRSVLTIGGFLALGMIIGSILFDFTLGLFFSTVGVLVVRSDLAQSHQSFLNYLGILSRSLPLCFFFVGTYYHDRFAFFDVFIKRGTYFFLLLLSLLAYFAFVDPLLDRSEVGRLKPWILALTLSPLLLLLPWAYSRMAL